LIRKSIVVEVDQERAFRVFTEGIDSWWPRTHHIGTSALAEFVLEPKEGGRWYGRGEDGSEGDAGRVLRWDPPSSLVLAWQITADWTYDSDLVTEVEVRFISEGARRTRVELEHRNLDRFGTKAAEMRTTFESPGGWVGLLESFARTAEQEP
jgi:uncharacterized protein YndB with AHSA1/START domain